MGHNSGQKYTLNLFCIYFLQKFEFFFIARVRMGSKSDMVEQKVIQSQNFPLACSGRIHHFAFSQVTLNQ